MNNLKDLEVQATYTKSIKNNVISLHNRSVFFVVFDILILIGIILNFTFVDILKGKQSYAQAFTLGPILILVFLILLHYVSYALVIFKHFYILDQARSRNYDETTTKLEIDVFEKFYVNLKNYIILAFVALVIFIVFPIVYALLLNNISNKIIKLTNNILTRIKFDIEKNRLNEEYQADVQYRNKRF